MVQEIETVDEVEIDEKATDAVVVNLQRCIRDVEAELEAGNNKFAVHRMSVYIDRVGELALVERESDEDAEEVYDRCLRDVQDRLRRMLTQGTRPSESDVRQTLGAVRYALVEFRG